MKKTIFILGTVSILFITGCGETELLQQAESAQKSAQECVNKGCSPYAFTQGNGWGTTLRQEGCVCKDK